jgi:AmiR/NasT family two-component response regulator
MLQTALTVAGCLVVGDADRAEDCVVLVERWQPEVIVTDVAVGDPGPYLDQLRAVAPGALLAVVSALAEDELRDSLGSVAEPVLALTKRERPDVLAARILDGVRAAG